MTSTFNLVIWFLIATHCLIMIIICAILFQTPPRITKLWIGHKQVSLKSMHKVQVQTVTLTFDLATWVLFATHFLVMMVICAKLFSNPIMHNKIMGLTRTGFAEVYAQSLSADSDLELCPSDTVLASDTSSCHDYPLCKIIFKSHHA